MSTIKKRLHKLLLLLLPLSFLYGLLMSLRAFCYKNNITPSYKSSLFVISIGNLTMGGTGKTPMVIYIAKLLKKGNHQPVIISRGYRGKAKNDVNIVSDGKAIILNASQAGDEPRLIADSLLGTPVLTGVKRPLPCKYAEEYLDTDLVILDDGFQHLPLKRDLDIVLFNSSSLKHHLRVFPVGELRESLNALTRADLIVFTSMTTENQVHVDNFLSRLSRYGISLPHFSFYKGHLCFFSHDDQFTLIDQGQLKTKRLLAFSGIANSSRFLESLKQLDISIDFFKKYRDHHTYTQNDIQFLIDKATQNKADGLVTTEKDYVKIKNLTFNIPLYISRLNLDQHHLFDQFILDSIPTKHPK